MDKISTNISLDPKLKEKAIKLFTFFGLDLSTAITLFLSLSVRKERIPFEIRLNIPNKETEEMKLNKKKVGNTNNLRECKIICVS